MQQENHKLLRAFAMATNAPLEPIVYMVRILGCLAEASCLLRIIMFLGIAYGLGTLFNDIRGETSAYAQDGPTELTDIWVSVLCTHS